jgi:hypothetical protein
MTYEMYKVGSKYYSHIIMIIDYDSQDVEKIIAYKDRITSEWTPTYQLMETRPETMEEKYEIYSTWIKVLTKKEVLELIPKDELFIISL